MSKKKRNQKSAIKIEVPDEGHRNLVYIAMMKRHKSSGPIVKRNKKRPKDKKNHWSNDWEN